MHQASEQEMKQRMQINDIPSDDDDSSGSDESDHWEQDQHFLQQVIQLDQQEKQQNDEEAKLGDMNLRERLGTMQLQTEVKNVNEHIIQNHQNTTSIPNPIKLLVSKQKRRYSLNGFNLDLTYITEKIIAMGFPAENIESIYRNSMQDVQRFFDTIHPNHYKIYNLCQERSYDASNFRNMVAVFPFEDHQAPTFTLIYEFCLDLDQWLKQHDSNVAGIHCKAGKGRTGVMICCYMLYAKQFANAYDSMRYYGLIRTKNKKGVTIPSQIRYIFYFEKALNNKWIPNNMPNVEVELVKIRLIPVPHLCFPSGCRPWYRIQNGKFECSSKQGKDVKYFRSEPYVELCPKGIYLKGDVLLQFYNQGFFGGSQKIFQAWFNTDFFDHTGILMIDKFMLDKACKDKSGKEFQKDFRMELHTVERSRANSVTDTMHKISQHQKLSF